MQQRILWSEEDVRVAENWIKEINQALVDAIVRAGLENLVISIDKITLLFMSLFYIPNLRRLLSQDIGAFLAFSIMDVVYWNFFGSLRNGKEDFERGKGCRLSMFFGLELDRAAILLLLAKSSTLVGEIESDLEVIA